MGPLAAVRQGAMIQEDVRRERWRDPRRRRQEEGTRLVLDCPVLPTEHRPEGGSLYG